MAFPTAVNSQITDSVTQRHPANTYLALEWEKAMRYLGTTWVMHSKSTYDIKKREPSGMCKTLHPVVLKAMQKGRL